MNNKNYWTPSVSSLDKMYKRGYNKDAFLEGFNYVSNPFPRKENQAPQKPVLQTLPYRKTYESGYSERDAFLDGFNYLNNPFPRKENQALQKPVLQTLPYRKTYESDYSESDAFLEGFNHVKNPFPQKEKQVLQKPVLQTLPYRPSADSGAKFQTLPYIPSKDIGHKTTLYSKLPSTYTHATKDLQTLLEKAWDKIKEPVGDRKNLLNELKNLFNNLSPEGKSAMKIVFNPLSKFNHRVEAAKILENEIKRIHYKRNEYNLNLPQTKEIAEKWGWKTEAADLHQNTAQDKEKFPHIKYVSPDGKREVIFNHTGTRVITADEDVGTYNYADPDLWIAHAILDILPWILYGNTPEDESLLSKIRSALSFENYKNH